MAIPGPAALHPCHLDRACEWRDPLLEARCLSQSDGRCRCPCRCRCRCRCRCQWGIFRSFFACAWGEPRSPTLALGPVLRRTGLPSRSALALVAPPLRLAALRWREAFVVLDRSRPPPGVSTACLVAVTHFSITPFPGEPHTVLCPSKLKRWRHNTVYGTPAGTRCLVISGVGGSDSGSEQHRLREASIGTFPEHRCDDGRIVGHDAGGAPGQQQTLASAGSLTVQYSTRSPRRRHRRMKRLAVQPD
jgi:hypothetical protein